MGFSKNKPCRKSGKVKFDTHEKALNRAGEILEENNSSKNKTLSAYLCPFCNKYHITSDIRFSRKQIKEIDLEERKWMRMVNKYL